MSFLDHYVEKHRLDKIPEKVKKNLSKLEEKIDDFVSDSKGPLTFEDCLKEHGKDLSDLVERLSNRLANLPELSLSGVFDLLRFVYNISVEIYQIVESMSGCVIDDSMGQEEKREAKVKLGKELVWLIWKTVDPFRDKFKWLPFKRKLEKMIVIGLAGMALKSIVDLFTVSSTQMSAMSVGQPIIKAL